MSSSAVGSEKSLITLLAEADIVVQLVILLLLLASIWSWTIIIHKWLRVTYITKRTKYFERVFGANSIEKLFEKIKNNPSTPIEKVFVTTIHKWNKLRSANLATQEIGTAIMIAKNRSISELEQGLSHLATIAASAPFIGLFGTVWGIMHSFQSIASAKNTSLAIVAPGIAEALFATGIGLAVAIPASIFYNLLVAKIHRIEDNLEDFSVEIHTILTHSGR